MGKVYLDIFRPEQLKRYIPRACEKDVPLYYDRILDIAEESVTLSILEKDTDAVIILGGVVVIWPGVAEAWSIASDLVKKYPRDVIHYCRLFLQTQMEMQNLRRLQLSVLTSEQVHRRFAEKLGFTDEGIMRKYGTQGEDHNRYARVI